MKFLNPKLYILGAASIIIAGLSLSAIAADEGFSPYVDEQGNISFPNGFRTSMVHLGSWFVPEGGASGFHDVYTEKDSVEAYRKTGKFPDGATIVKELRASAAGTYTTGANVSYATDGLKQWFVMIKDEKGRFEDNPIWAMAGVGRYTSLMTEVQMSRPTTRATASAAIFRPKITTGSTQRPIRP
jgi:hypothetical protein